jgi:hypothetical protein
MVRLVVPLSMDPKPPTSVILMVKRMRSVVRRVKNVTFTRALLLVRGANMEKNVRLGGIIFLEYSVLAFLIVLMVSPL